MITSKLDERQTQQQQVHRSSGHFQMLSDQNQNVGDGLLGRLFKLFTAPDPNPGSTDRSDSVFITFCNPGITLRPSDLDFGDLSTREQVNRLAAFSQIVNSVPKGSGPWFNNALKVWSIYERALYNIELPLPDTTSDEARRNEEIIKRCRDYLVKKVVTQDPFTGDTIEQELPSDYVVAYNKFATEYDAAIRKYVALQIESESPVATPEKVREWVALGEQYKSAIAAASARWSAEGNRANVDKARFWIKQISESGPEALYTRLRNEFELSRKTDFMLGGSFHPTFYGGMGMLNDPNLKWSEFTFKEEQRHEHSNYRSTQWGGGGGFRAGLWSFGASAQHSRVETHGLCDTSNLELAVEVTQVPLFSSWLDPSIFYSKGWKWASGTSFNDVSDGNMNGDMPFLPSSMILARNLKIGMDLRHETQSDIREKLETKASIGWGPFSVKGNYTKETQEQDHNLVVSDTGITCSSVVILGFMCDILPKSPNPDPRLRWQHESFISMMDEMFPTQPITIAPSVLDKLAQENKSLKRLVAEQSLKKVDNGKKQK